jgi:ABC-type antimicrobial peptide transport system permease subunit
MNNRTILALAGLAMLSLSAISTIGLGSSSSVQAQSLQSNQNSNTTVSIVKNNATMDDVKQHLHTQLDGAIMAAQNNDTFGVLMGLGQITEGLAAINTPEYFLFEDSLSNNGTTLANTSETSTTPQIREEQ